MKEVTFFTRDGCHLCDDALVHVEEARRVEPFTLTIVDLDREASEDKRAAYTWEVPVVELDGRKVMKFKVDPERLLRLLRS